MLEFERKTAEAPRDSSSDRLAQIDQRDFRVANAEMKSTDDCLVPRLELTDQREIADKLNKPGDYKETLTLAGVDRHFDLHVPPNYDPSKPMPLVLVLHGHGDDAGGIEKISGMNAEADKKGFIVAYPEAIKWMGERGMAAWDTGNGLVPPGSTHVDESAFLRNVINSCQSNLSIDKDRTYLAGFSNGGMEAYKAATELSDKLAAVVAVSGAMSGTEVKPQNPVSMLSIVGTSDEDVPPSGRTMQEQAASAVPRYLELAGVLFPDLKNKPITPAQFEQLQKLAIDVGFVPQFKPVTYATDFWKTADGITAPGTLSEQNGISTQTYTNPTSGVTVKQETIAGADHMVQHGVPAGFNLADEVWNFFQEHPKQTHT